MSLNILFRKRTGAILTEDQRGSTTELLFKYAVARINRDPELLPNTTLLYDIHYVSPEDSFHASKKGVYKAYTIRLQCRLCTGIYITRLHGMSGAALQAVIERLVCSEKDS